MSIQKILPATQTIASLQPHYLMIELPTYKEAQVRQALAGARDIRAVETVAHELHHWFDIVGTVWGQTYLGKLFAALDAAIDPAAGVGVYPAALSLFDLDRSILFPTYYKYVRPGAPSDTKPGAWSFQLTTGARIDTRGVSHELDPILFMRFQTATREIGRQPLSVGALLELRAMASEIHAFRDTTLEWPKEERTVEEKLFEQRFLRTLYAPELLTYSAAAHFIGKQTNDTDFGQAFGLGSALADVALNLTPGAYTRLRTPPIMKQWVAKRVAGFRNNRDLGFAFVTMGLWAATASGLGGVPLFAFALRASGLADPEVIYGTAETFIQRQDASRLRDCRLRAIREKTIEAGVALIGRRKLHGGTFSQADWPTLPTPPMIDPDLNVFHLGQAALSQTDVDYLYDCDSLLNDITRQALRAGRGLDFGYTDWIY